MRKASTHPTAKEIVRHLQVDGEVVLGLEGADHLGHVAHSQAAVDLLGQVFVLAEELERVGEGPEAAPQGDGGEHTGERTGVLGEILQR